MMGLLFTSLVASILGTAIIDYCRSKGGTRQALQHSVKTVGEAASAGTAKAREVGAVVAESVKNVRGKEK
jgi:hypothetical protein